MRARGSPAFMPPFLTAIGLQQSGRVAEALAHYRRAIRIDAKVPDVHNNYGCALLALGRHAEAAAALERALALRPDYAAALDNLGLVRAHLERRDEAVELHERAVALEPANPTFRVHLGTALAAAGRHAEARAAFEEALRLAPGDATAQNGLGIVLDRLGRGDEAEAAFRAALARNPMLAEAACNLGNSLLQAGDLGGATTMFERALELEPRNGRFHRYLVLIRSGAIEPAQLAQMERLAAEIGTLPRPQRVELRFALAAAYEHLGRYEEAFAQLAAGNALKRAAIAYDEAAAVRSAAALEGTYSEAFCAALRGCGHPSTRPIFVFGMPRSGTTLVEQLLAAQPAVVAGGELTVLDGLARELAGSLAAGAPVAELRALVRAVGERYLSATDALAGEATHLTDKMPGNFWYAPLIALALPNARMVHVRRDRLDTSISCFATLFVDQLVPYAYDLGELGRYYRAYERIMTAWRALLPANRFIEVEYERLVEDFATEARRLVAFCELAWDDRTLAFHEVQGPVRTASNIQVRRPLYQSAVGRSRFFAAHLGPLIDALK